MSEFEVTLFEATFDPERPYNTLPGLPPQADIET